MARPLHTLRDGAQHFRNNPINTATGPVLILDVPTMYAAIYRPGAERKGITELPPPTEIDTSAPPLPVRVNGNRWVVVCDLPLCGGAEYAWPDDPRFMCGSCFNASTGGKWRTVVWPGDDTIEEIETVLSARVSPFTRNWNPEEEDADDLRAQNRQAGDPEAADWQGNPPEKRIKRSRPANERNGTQWGQIVHKRPKPPRGTPIVLPSGWSPEPTVVAAPEAAASGSGVLYPDVPPPLDTGIGGR
jgi:hypothetical protein